MSRILNYLRQEGLATTAKKAFNKIFHKSVSQTVFLRIRLTGELENCFSSNIEILGDSNRAFFEAIKFWDFICVDDFIDNEYQSIAMLKNRDEYIAYAAEEHAINRVIHGLGDFHLKLDEGWIGPVYLRKQWRGKGHNKRLLLHQLRRLKAFGVTTVYTAINSQNSASLKSFKSVGFEEIGIVDEQGIVKSDQGGVLRRAFRKMKDK